MNLDPLLSVNEQHLFYASLQQHAQRSIRMRHDRCQTEFPFVVSPVLWNSRGRFLIDSNVRPAAFLNYAAADYYIQDAASMLPLTLLNVQLDDWVLDLCAAPGGKASAIAEQLGPSGFLLANESIRSRVDILRYALARTGKPTYATCSYDPDKIASHAPHIFDSVLVDAPCSGQALVGKNKRDVNAFATNQIEHCVLRQRRILMAAASLVKQGGKLVYSTCTFAPEENELQMRWLRESMPGCWEPLVSAQLEPWLSPLESGCYRLWPHRDHCAGGFAAGLICVQECRVDSPSSQSNASKQRFDESNDSATRRRNRKERPRSSSTGLPDAGLFLETVGRLQGVEWLEKQNEIYVANHESEWAIAMESLALEPACLAVSVGKHRVPTQALAMLSKDYFESNHSIELNDNNAIEYANGSPIPRTLTEFSGSVSWCLACWQGKPLGWLKSAGNRWNNHLPAWARLHV